MDTVATDARPTMELTSMPNDERPIVSIMTRRTKTEISSRMRMTNYLFSSVFLNALENCPRSSPAAYIRSDTMSIIVAPLTKV